MGLFHLATVTPTKEDLIARWVPTQAWGPAEGTATEVVGSFRFDDPEGRVGMETHLVRAGDLLLQVPLTYRDEPLAGAEHALISEMEHSVLGTRWVYDGIGDPRYVMLLAGAALTGQGEVLGMAEVQGRWYVAPADVRMHGGGWSQGPVALDGFEPDGAGDPATPVLRNDRFSLRVFRRPVEGAKPPMGLTATWEDQPAPVVLAGIEELT